MPTTSSKHWFTLRRPEGAGKRGLECGHHAHASSERNAAAVDQDPIMRIPRLIEGKNSHNYVLAVKQTEAPQIVGFIYLHRKDWNVPYLPAKISPSEVSASRTPTHQVHLEIHLPCRTH